MNHLVAAGASYKTFHDKGLGRDCALLITPARFSGVPQYKEERP